MSATPVRVQRLPTPYLTYALIAANVGVWLVTLALGHDIAHPTPTQLFDVGGNFGPATLGHDPWRLLTSMFLHGGVLHLTMNMLALAPTGRQVETLYGRPGMGAIYLIAGLLGALTSAMRGAACRSARRARSSACSARSGASSCATDRGSSRTPRGRRCAASAWCWRSTC
jgi:membrane associated rhomboid family serine protease